MLRIDRAVRPQGLIKSARFFSIILNEKGLFLLNVAPAPGMVVRPKNAIDSMAVNYALKRIDKKLEEGEKVLASMPIEQFARRKGSFFFPREDVTAAIVDTNYAGLPRITIRATGKKWKLLIPEGLESVAENVIAELTPR